jgi:hypothetical protein
MMKIYISLMESEDLLELFVEYRHSIAVKA